MKIVANSVSRTIILGVTVALLSGVLAPIATATSANATENGEYECTTGLPLGGGDNGPTYTITSGVVTSASDCIGTVVIPEGVTSIGTQAFYGSNGLTSITIPATVTSIGNSAFSYTTALSSITFPVSVTSIGDYAFYNATALTSAALPAGLISIGVGVFFGASALASITIPDGVTSIGDYAFSNARSLNSVSIPESVTTFGIVAFAYTTSLSSITIPASVTTIGRDAFEGAQALKDVFFLGNAPTVGDGIFRFVTGGIAHIKAIATGFPAEGQTWNGLTVAVPPADGSYVCTTGLLREVSDTSPTFTSTGGVVSDGRSCTGAVVIPEGVTSIGFSAFYDAQSITSVTLPSTLITLGDFAFERTTSLTSISIPARVTSIGLGAFYSTHSLATVTFAADSRLTTIGDSAFIGANVSAFLNTVLTSISIPAGVKRIGDFAFPGAISSIYFLGDAPNVSASTFSFVASGAKGYVTAEATGFGDDDYWNGLSIARLGTYTVTYNYNSATGGNSVATSSFATFGTPITLPSPTRNGYKFAGWYSDAGLTSKIGNAGASYSPTGANLSKIIYAKWVEPVFTTSANGDDTVTVTGCTVTANCSGDLVMPVTIGGKTVTSIGQSAFFGYSLTSVTIPYSVTSIGDSAFAGNLLTSVTIPDSVTSIGDSAFAGNQLTSVTFSGDAPADGGYIFQSNPSLSSVVVPSDAVGFSSTFSGVTVSYTGDPIHVPVFATSTNIDDTLTITRCTSNCSGDLAIPGTISGKTVTSIGFAALLAKGLTSVTIPSSVTSIGNEAFGSNQLKSVTIPSSVMSIGNSAFERNQLTSVTIPSSVTSIGNFVFRDNQLASVTIPSSVSSIGSAAFQQNKLTSVTIPNSVTSIGALAFQYNHLSSVTIPNSVTSIGDSAFYGNMLTSVTIPNFVTSIGDAAFANNQLTSVTIPNSVTSIRELAFSGNQLTSVTFLGDAPTDGGSIFTFNSALSSIVVPIDAVGFSSTFSGVPVSFTGDPIRPAVTYKAAYARGAKLTGKAKVGKSITVKPGIWNGTTPITYKYQWYSCKVASKKVLKTGKAAPKCKVIKKATKSTFKVTAKENGTYLAVLITGANGVGKTKIFTATVGKVS